MAPKSVNNCRNGESKLTRFVEDGLKLSLSSLRRSGVRPGTYAACSWSNGLGEEVATIGIRCHDDQLQLTYSVTRPGDGQPLEVVNETVLLKRAGRNERRLYFVCPGCSSSMDTLYLPFNGTRFRCRSCHDLKYRQGRRSRSRLSRLFDALFWEPGLPWPALTENDEARLQSVLTTGNLDALFGKSHSSSSLAGRWGKPGRPPKSAVQEARNETMHGLRGQVQRQRRPRGRPKERRPYHWHTMRDKQPISEGEAYCVKCKRGSRLVYTRPGLLTNGRRALLGRCHTCRTRLCRMVPATR
jgi:hypothetical protein